MAIERRGVRILALVACLGMSAGCSKSGDNGAPILDSTHLGWKNQDCSVCKDLPVEDHTTTQPFECAACHGGNGACDPNGSANATRTHQGTDDCITCHQNNHGFQQASECAACHFAPAGLDDGCGIDPPQDGGVDAGSDGGNGGDGGADGGNGGDGVADGGADAGGPTLSTAVSENCFNWPQDPFSPTNNTGGVSTALGEQEPAVELALQDTGGTAHTLSELLETRPVLMVFGSFT